MKLPTNSILASYLEGVLGYAVVVEAIQPLGRDTTYQKAYGYGAPVMIEYRDARSTSCERNRAVLHTTAAAPFGHEHRADRAADWLWSYDTFNTLPRHVRCLDVGAFRIDDKAMVSLGKTGEYFLLTEYADGQEYARDLQRLAHCDEPADDDVARADALCDYLLDIHHLAGGDPSLYTRRIRELIGSGECIMGLADSYDFADPVWTPGVLEDLERQLVPWRWRLKSRSHRLRQVHGDFHPWNILFSDRSTFSVLDRSRGEWGDPADDIACLTINFIFESMQVHDGLQGALSKLFDRFWQRYLIGCGNKEILEVAAPFFVFRALVLASPVWFPNVASEVRERLLLFCRNILAADRFNPERINEYLNPEQGAT